MLSEFKRSDLDYVIFDMPSLRDTSATLPLAAFMDMVLLVVEAEKSNRNAVKRAYTQLAAKTRVSVVFNKSRSYGPRWLGGELSWECFECATLHRARTGLSARTAP